MGQEAREPYKRISAARQAGTISDEDDLLDPAEQEPEVPDSYTGAWGLGKGKVGGQGKD